MKFVFLHGGPGFNSFAEQTILGPCFQSCGHEIAFWNEPSRMRPEGDPFESTHAFERWLASAERFVLDAAAMQPVHLIVHCVTVLSGMEIARRHPNRLASLVCVAPSANAFASFSNVLRLAHDDLLEAKPEVAAAIANSLERTRAVLDDAMREGLLNVLHDERLFTHYWADPDQMQASFAAQARPEGRFDLDSFFAVLADYGHRGGSLLSTAPVTTPTLALFGVHDPITPADEQSHEIQAAIPNARIDALAGCGHYIHLDRPQHFVDIVVKWAASVARQEG